MQPHKDLNRFADLKKQGAERSRAALAGGSVAEDRSKTCAIRLGAGMSIIVGGRGRIDRDADGRDRRRIGR